ncbi:hypothetical protein SGCZBJ_17870 [Caulobacter zeae]|uniref:Uncharacterized protein n=2 Tax=Caulobacter TaxID=75 RepID=A0A2T9JEL2_9CAUL|nr:MULTISPECIES: hypothetical protein [Caulobacter]PLR22640.1 hypothetical protein SGCZBJ_17870 [Caulobacter zeae]PVM82142.1 hypothetical protein DDF67_24355 [Caulobacter endophyticus]
MSFLPEYAVLLGAPVIVAVVLYVLVERSRLAWLSKPIVIGSGLARLSEISFEPKDIMRAVAIAFPLFVYSNVYSLPDRGLLSLATVGILC